MSSSAKRCLATLGPLAAACGLPVGTAEFLSEGSDAGSALMQAKELAAGGGVPVLCTHGDVMASIVMSLAGAHVPMAGGMQWGKAGTWAFDISAGRIAGGRYLPPPG